MEKPRLIFMTSAYRFNNLPKVAESIDRAFETYKRFHKVYPSELMDLAWFIKLDDVNSFGCFDYGEGTVFESLRSKNLYIDITWFHPDEKLDPKPFNEVIEKSFELWNDENAYFLMLDDDNKIIFKLFESFMELSSTGRDVLYFSMLESSGRFTHQIRQNFDIRLYSMDPSRTAFTYKIWSEIGPIRNGEFEYSKLWYSHIDSDCIYDLGWYALLSEDRSRIYIEHEDKDTINSIPSTLHNALSPRRVMKPISDLSYIVLHDNSSIQLGQTIYLTDDQLEQIMKIIGSE